MPRIVPNPPPSEVFTIQDPGEVEPPLHLFQNLPHSTQTPPIARPAEINEHSEKFVVVIVAFVVIILLGAVVTIVMSKK